MELTPKILNPDGHESTLSKRPRSHMLVRARLFFFTLPIRESYHDRSVPIPYRRVLVGPTGNAENEFNVKVIFWYSKAFGGKDN
ncbi:9159_t:CDS:2 [Ambispora gerdemannii]|uniref:9159_t:CDS:1 n=1 Tax=Ambispora gerdemannii TaxID=144530 RepID=A0A9N9D3V7_9GLOM|nr:9159_t:CDS:2 [Ambispora gerdemannii]